MFSGNLCKETVSILEAIFFGANQSCVDLGTLSLATALGVFTLSVVLFSYIGGRILRKLLPLGKEREPDTSRPVKDAHEGPIKSTGAWRRNVN